jgi:hypothetical protein
MQQLKANNRPRKFVQSGRPACVAQGKQASFFLNKHRQWKIRSVFLHDLMQI